VANIRAGHPPVILNLVTIGGASALIWTAFAKFETRLTTGTFALQLERARANPFSLRSRALIRGSTGDPTQHADMTGTVVRRKASKL